MKNFGDKTPKGKKGKSKFYHLFQSLKFWKIRNRIQLFTLLLVSSDDVFIKLTFIGCFKQLVSDIGYFRWKEVTVSSNDITVLFLY